MRTIKELLELMLQHKGLFETGLCWWRSVLWHHDIITLEESINLIRFLNGHLPPKNHPSDIYCWPRGDIAFRIEWINEQIKKLEDENKSTN
jgi:hypothetical protein